MLTRKQANLLRYISDQITKDGVSPSFDEMKDALGLKSKSGVHRLIMALEERGVRPAPAAQGPGAGDTASSQRILVRPQGDRVGGHDAARLRRCAAACRAR